MTVGLKKVGILATVAAVVLALGMFRPGVEPDRAEASILGAWSIPSSVPGLIPAIAPASPPGNIAVAGVKCQDPLAALPTCPISTATLTGALNLTLTRVFPDGPPAARFAFNGGTTLVCDENSLVPPLVGPMPCDVDIVPGDGNVAVQVNGGGQNEVVNVEVCDQTGSCQNTTIIFVETIFAVSPLHAAASFTPTIVSYACPVRATKTGGDVVDPGLLADNLVDMEDIFGDGAAFDLIDTLTVLGMLPAGTALALPENFGPAWGCGTSAPSAQNRVSFETDAGILSVEGFAPGFLAPGVCAAGDSVDVTDGAMCDIDGFDAVVSYGLEGTGDVGTASITAQQLGGGGPLREIRVVFTGGPALSLFIEAPATIGIEGDDFTVTLVDQDFRPVPNETIQCLIEPASAGFAVTPPTGTTGAVPSDDPGAVTMNVVATPGAVLSGEEITLTCELDRDRSVSASATINLSGAPDMELVDLVGGCQIVTPTEDLATAALRDRFDPEYDSAWLLDAASGTWLGDSPAAGAPSAGPNDLDGVDRLEGFFACMPDGGGTFERAVI